MAQAPMIAIPRKATEEVDWTTPIRHLIAQSYGESPDNYAAECAALQRCRQDAVRGAGSDMTARDLLYKYFGQLELLELRFSEIKVTFPWHDAFTSKLTTQSSIAYEKASVLFQIAATHSSIAASQSRSDPEGQKRAFYYFRTCAGMLTYINENFLHAPSTDLSRDVIKFLSNLILAQATEVFYEKCVDEKKGSALVAKVASQAAGMYTSLCEEVKEFMGKGIFDRNWVTLIQIKSKYFNSLTQYHRSLADSTSSKHGDSLSRLTLSETLSKEALRAASSFSSAFLPNLSPTLPADAGTSIHELLKSQSALVSNKKAEASRENDLIYNAIVPAPEALSAVEKLVVATPVPIHDVYSTPEVQKTIGQDIFLRLVPLSVHESASVYSEEKAKLVRGEVERVEGAEGEVRSVIEGMGVKEGLGRFRAMAEGEVGGGEEIPQEVQGWKEEVKRFEGGNENVERKLVELTRLKENVKNELESISRELEIETRDCEELRVRYEHRWTMEPSAGLSKVYRQDLKEHLGAFEAAGASDAQVSSLWAAVRPEIALLLGSKLEQMFRDQAGGQEQHLLDVDVDGGEEKEERARIGGYVAEIEDRMGRLNVLKRERGVVLKDLKEKVQADDVSHLLLLNRRNSSVEPALFAAELEKFRPFQQQIATNIQQQGVMLQEVSTLWKRLKEHAGRGPGARKWEERERRKKDLVRRFGEARDVYMEVRDGVAKGLQFYTELTDLGSKLGSDARSFVARRKVERENLQGKLETEDKLSAKPPPLAAKPPLPPPPHSMSTPMDKMAGSFAGMNLGHGQGSSSTSQPPSMPPPPPSSYPPPAQSYQYSPPPLPQHHQPQHQQQYGGPQYGSPHHPSSPPLHHPSHSPPTQPYRQGSLSLPPPPPPQVPMHSSSPSNYQAQGDPYSSLGMFTGPSAPPPPPSQTQGTPNGYPQQHQQQQPQQGMYFPPPPQPQHQRSGSGGSFYQPPAQQGYGGSAFPPPPPPPQQQAPGSYGGMFPPPPPQQPPQGGYGYGGYGR